MHVLGIDPRKGGEDREDVTAGAERNLAMVARESPVPTFLPAKSKRCPHTLLATEQSCFFSAPSLYFAGHTGGVADRSTYGDKIGERR